MSCSPLGAHFEQLLCPFLQIHTGFRRYCLHPMHRKWSVKKVARWQNLIPSFPWIAPPTPRRPLPWHNPRKGWDQIFPSGNLVYRPLPMHWVQAVPPEACVDLQEGAQHLLKVRSQGRTRQMLLLQQCGPLPQREHGGNRVGVGASYLVPEPRCRMRRRLRHRGCFIARAGL